MTSDIDNGEHQIKFARRWMALNPKYGLGMSWKKGSHINKEILSPWILQGGTVRWYGKMRKGDEVYYAALPFNVKA